MNRRKPVAPLQLLVSEPARFTFDAAVRVLMFLHRKPASDAVRFEAAPGLAFPGSEVTRATVDEAGTHSSLTVSVFGLTGPSGVLPRHYSEVAAGRNRSSPFRSFLDVLAQRMTAFFAAAGLKYRLHRAADQAELHRVAGTVGRENAVHQVLLALTGYGTPHLVDRLITGPLPLQHYAGLFSARPRSADRLAALVSDWLGRPVHVEQFVGAWLPIAPDQLTRLAIGGGYNRLGHDAAIGIRAWDQQAGIVLRLGPLDLRTFESLLPHRPALRHLVGLVRTFVGFEVNFGVNPVLARAQVPPLRLATEEEWEPRLSWNTWLPAEGLGNQASDQEANEAVFNAEAAEREPG